MRQRIISRPGRLSICRLPAFQCLGTARGLSKLVMLIFLLQTSISSIAFAAYCSDKKILFLQREGLTDDDIYAICRNYDPDYDYGSGGSYYAPGPAAFCYTQLGRCLMGDVVPQGASCVCPSAYGYIPGIAK